MLVVAGLDPKLQVHDPGATGDGLGVAAQASADFDVALVDQERLVLEAASGRTIQSVLFRTARPWPEAADGEGPSLVPIRPESRLDPDLPRNWRASSERGGTPGR